MCFFLYLASRSRAPLIPWDPGKPALCVEDHGEALRLDKGRFTLPKVVYVGSDQQCGCGFRNMVFQPAGSCEEWLEAHPDYEPPEGSQPNHQQLADYLRKHFADEDFVEIYGCWAGDEKEPVARLETIPRSRILEPKFQFMERVRYRVYDLKGDGGGRRPQ